VEPLLRPPVARRGWGRPTEVDLRRVLAALFSMNRTGCQWRYLPAEFPAWGAVRSYFDKWEVDGTWERVNDALRRQVRVAAGRDPEPSAGSIDSQMEEAMTVEPVGEAGARDVLGRQFRRAAVHGEIIAAEWVIVGRGGDTEARVRAFGERRRLSDHPPPPAPALRLRDGLVRAAALRPGRGRLDLSIGEQRSGERVQARIGRQANRVADAGRGAVVVEGGTGDGAVGAQLNRHPRPARLQRCHQPRQDGDGAPATVRVPRTEHGGEALIGVAVTHQQRVIHMLAEAAMSGAPFLLPVRRVGRGIEVQQDARRPTAAAPLAQIHAEQRGGQAHAGPRRDRVLQAGDRRLTGEVRACLRQPPTDQLQERVAPPQAIGTTRRRPPVGRRWRPGPRRQAGLPAARGAPRSRAASASASQGKPPSLVSRPPSNVTRTGRPDGVGQAQAGGLDGASDAPAGSESEPPESPAGASFGPVPSRMTHPG
jgi:transposase